MKFKTKLKVRLYLTISYMTLGVAMLVVFNIPAIRSEYLATLGLIMAVMGIARFRNHFIITKNEESIRRQEIAENDERNIAIANKAKGVAFIIYILTASIAIIVLQLFGETEAVNILSLSVSALVFIYWISYIIISKRT